MFLGVKRKIPFFLFFKCYTFLFGYFLRCSCLLCFVILWEWHWKTPWKFKGFAGYISIYFYFSFLVSLWFHKSLVLLVLWFLMAGTVHISFDLCWCFLRFFFLYNSYYKKTFLLSKVHTLDSGRPSLINAIHLSR